MKPQALIVFVKSGQNVKTRIAAETNAQTALDIYKQLMTACANVCHQLVNTEVIVYYTPYIDAADVWEGIAVQKVIQSEGDLGDRMKSAFAAVLQNYQKAVIIGSDCPYLTTEILEEAFGSLDKAATVIGPAIDGGYYLLGMTGLHDTLFEGIQWSTKSVYYDTVDRIFSIGLSLKILARLSDVDYYVDYVQWKNNSNP